MVLAELNNIEQQQQRKFQTLTRIQRTALDDLSKNEKVRIIPPDKGDAIFIQDRDV